MVPGTTEWDYGLRWQVRMLILLASIIILIIGVSWLLARGGVFSTLRRFDEQKKLYCYIGFLVPTIEGVACADPEVRKFFEGEFQLWLKQAEQNLGWVVASEDRSFKPDSSEPWLGGIPALEKFSKEQRLICYDTFLVPLLMNMARRDGSFRRNLVEGFLKWERDMRRLFG